MNLIRSRAVSDHTRTAPHDPVYVNVPTISRHNAAKATGREEEDAETAGTARLHHAVPGHRTSYRAALWQGWHLFVSILGDLCTACMEHCCCCCWKDHQPPRRPLLRWYRMLKQRRLLCCAAFSLFLILFSTLSVIAFAVILLTWDHPLTQIIILEYLGGVDSGDLTMTVPGVTQPREPQRLWGITVQPPVLLVNQSAGAVRGVDAHSLQKQLLKTRLEALYGESLILYTFANGTELNHGYRRLHLAACGAFIQSVEAQLALMDAVTDGKGTTEFCTTPMQLAKTNDELLQMLRSRTLSSVTGRDRETDELRHSIRSVEQHVRWHRGRVVIVSPGHYPTWVDAAKNFLAGRCGDKKVQALRKSGTHLRLTTVHQDALMPTLGRLTVNTHPIEQQLWRVRNITPVHVYMNDDYFVNRDVAITDLFNEYGGTIVRTESGLVSQAVTGNDTVATWAEGVSHTNYFSIRELDLTHEDDVPERVLRLWRQYAPDDVTPFLSFLSTHLPALMAGTEPLPAFAGQSHRHAIWRALDDDTGGVEAGKIPIPASMLQEEILNAYRSHQFGAIRPRFFATHAPFVYCTNMLRHLATRYELEYLRGLFLHRSRASTDLYVPFLYNAFIMARPWQASPRFPAYVLLRQELESRVKLRTEALAAAAVAAEKKSGVEETAKGPTENATTAAMNEAARQVGYETAKAQLQAEVHLDPIKLDNGDGCAPATMLVGRKSSESLFGRFTDHIASNSLYIRQIRKLRPMFFNINTGATTRLALTQLREFLETKFPVPVYLEKDSRSPSKDERQLQRVFAELMELPVIVLASYDEAICALVRSLALAFADQHRGHVYVRRHRFGLGEVDATMAETRYELRYLVRSALTTADCTFNDAVHVQERPREESLEDVVRAALMDEQNREPGTDRAVRKDEVELPSTCGESGAGLRVRGFVVDARTPDLPVRKVDQIHEALAVPGQTLALEDFRVVTVGPGPRDVVLVLAREDAAAKAVHWVTGGAENDLLVTYPLPVPAYEDMSASVRWLDWQAGETT